MAFESSTPQQEKIADVYETVKNSLVYIYDDNSKPCSDDPKERGMASGTGFFVAIVEVDKENKATGRQMKFLVTNQHVLQNPVIGADSRISWIPKKDVILRMNSKDKTSLVCSPLQLRWEGPDKNVYTLRADVDLAAIPVGDIENTWPAMFEYSTMILNNKERKAFEADVGTDVFTFGYLLAYAGNQKNVPAARFGKIAMISEEKWYSSERGLSEEAYLVELNTTYGASGSPVLLIPGQVRVGDRGIEYRSVKPAIIGVIKGSTNTFTPVKELNRMSNSYVIDPTRKAMAPIGLAAVEPGQNLKSLFEEIVDVLETQGFHAFGRTRN